MPDSTRLAIARRQLANGVGQNTQRNRVLTLPALAVQIPARLGIALSPSGPSAYAPFARGFVAVAHGAATGKLFDPYTLTVLAASYSLVHAQYASAGFATDHNVPPADTTHWHDTLSFFDAENALYINAEQYPDLLIDPLDLSFSARPYLIPSTTVPSLPYGDATENATNKRVFAVGRADVKSWAFGGTTETLTPTAPRSSNKAMTIGPRTDPATDKAWLGQLYFTAISWYDNGGTWAFSDAEITMLLTSPYLSKVSSAPTVEQPTLTWPAGTPSSHSIDNATTLPSTGITLTGTGELEGTFTYETDLGPAYVVWPWGGIWSQTLPGRITGTDNSTVYATSDASSPIQAGVTLTYTSSNSKTVSVQGTTHNVTAGDVFTPVTESSGSEAILENYSNVLTWTGTAAEGPLDRGVKKVYVNGASISGTNATKTIETQTGAASVKIGTAPLIEMTWSVSRTSGTEAVITAKNNWFDTYLANPYGLVHVSSGLGTPADIWVRTSGGISYYKNPGGSAPAMPQYAKDEITAAVAAFRAAYIGTTLYDVVSSREPYYNGSTTAINTGNSALDWTTTDYILRDTVNGVYITVNGTFSANAVVGGSKARALVVKLKIQTPHHTNETTLYSLSDTPAALFNEKQIGATGRYAVPTPKMRAIFAPLAQAQGDFKGAAYTTAAEETAGATPAHLFRFLLYLRPYDAITSLDADNAANPEVRFIPCNLLEALYMTTFSQEMGVHATRYPVTDTTTYNAIIAGLFTTPTAVHIRDGVDTDWSSALGVSAADLYRT